MDNNLSVEALDTLTLKRDQIKLDLVKLSKLVFQKENELIEIEKQLTKFSDNIILENLKQSKQQEEIINATEDYVLVLACPGSGKTHTVICRYVKLVLTERYRPDQILLITFTKKAGMEMSNRLNKAIPNKLPYHVGSLHGLSYKVLQEYGGNKSNYTVLDEKDVRDYLRDLIDNTKALSHLNNSDIDIIKNKIQTVIDQASTHYPFDMKVTLKKNNLEKYQKECSTIYRLYQQKKKKENTVDFNDLMVMFCKFLDDEKSLEFRSKIKYVFFDEYQDVNPIQNYILKKLSITSQVMAVGDDAQSIYSFRGGSVKFIMNFFDIFNDENKTKKLYLLSENYRSTPAIVNFCQDIINHNSSKYTKNVTSRQEESGFKPCVFSFNTKREQYEWIVNDIIKKNQEGVKFSDMVILSRKNNLLDEIELYLIKSGNKIPVSKHIGLSLLDKSHVKDFLSWISILYNPKATIHWKRIISLHPEYNTKKANDVISDSCTDVLKAIKEHIENSRNNNPSYKGLIDLYDSILHLNKITRDIDKARFILNYLEKLWIDKKEPNVKCKVDDLYNLLNYLKTSSLNNFITDLYLNQDVETHLDDVLFLSTIHGAKGLEWSHVYIVDMDSRNFPSIRPKYYLEELEEVEEERRLFYVASSRSKKFLSLTFTEESSINYQSSMSPLLREINSELYTGCGIKPFKFIPSLVINRDIQNYLRLIGYHKVDPYLRVLNNKKTIINKPFDLPNLDKLTNKGIISNFIDHLICKMIQINYPDKIKKFDLNLMYKDHSFPQKLYLNYIDTSNHWENILDIIFHIVTYKLSNNSEINLTVYYNLLINPNIVSFYKNELQKGICKMIDNIKPREIYTHYIVSVGGVKCEINLLCDYTIVDIKPNLSGYCDVTTVSNIAQSLIYGYLLKKKDNKVNNLIIYDPINGESNNINLSDFNFIKFKKTIYNSD